MKGIHMSGRYILVGVRWYKRGGQGVERVEQALLCERGGREKGLFSIYTSPHPSQDQPEKRE